MTMTKREKTVVRNGLAKLRRTRIAKTDRMVKQALNLMGRESAIIDELEEQAKIDIAAESAES